MPIEAAFENLTIQMDVLLERVQELGVTVVEDHPMADAPALVDRLEEASSDLIGSVTEASRGARAARDAAGHPGEHGRVWRGLRLAQEMCNRVSRQLCEELLGYEPVDELRTMGEDRGQEWQAWTASVKEGLDHCLESLYGVADAILVCWTEVADRAQGASVAVHSHSVGQEINLSAGSQRNSGGARRRKAQEGAHG